MDSPAETVFDDLTRLAAHVCGTPIALISLVDDQRQWFKARLGLEVCSTDREIAFCAHALAGRSVLEVPDATVDPRFRENPLVIGDPWIRFYAGAPLVTADGHALGTLCVLDVVPRLLDDHQRSLLMAMAAQVVSHLESRRSSDALAAEVAEHEVDRARLRSTQRYLQGILTQNDAVVYAKDVNGRFTLANATLQQLLGLPEEQIVGHRDSDLFPAAAAAAFARNDQEIMASGTAQLFEEQAPHPDGSIHHYQSRKFPLFDDAGQVYAVACVSTDVTELIATRQALTESEARWRQLVEYSPVAVAVIAADSLCFRYANARSADVYGCPADELVGRSSVDLVDQQHRAAYLSAAARVVSGRPLLDTELSITGFDGRRRSVEVNATAVTYNGERAVQVEIRDVSARVAAAEALRVSEERFRMLWTCLPVGAIECHPDGTVLAVNPAFCEMLGYSAAELTGPSALTQPDLCGGAPNQATSEQVYRHRDGRLVPVIQSVSGVRDGAGEALRWLATVVDVTERVASEARLAEAHADLGARQAFTETLLDSIDVGIVACDAAGRLTVFNRASREWHGLEADPLMSPEDFSQSYDLYDEDGVTPLGTDRIPLLRALREGSVRDVEFVIAPRGRDPIRALCSGRALLGVDGAVQGAIVAMRDITELRAESVARRASQERFRAAFAGAPIGIALLDDHARMVQTNVALSVLLRRPESELLSLEQPLSMVHPQDRPALLAMQVQSRADPGVPLHLEARLIQPEGSTRWGLFSLTALESSENATHVLQIQDITEQRDLQERLTRQALYDPLTNLPNRIMLLDRVAQALARSVRHPDHGLTAVLFLDLNGFKTINDSYGHEAGDQVLATVAQRVRAAVRPADTVSRLGGDEFVVLCENLSTRQEAARIAARIQTEIAAPIPCRDGMLTITASVGLAHAVAGQSAEDLIRQADTEMYEAKRAR